MKRSPSIRNANLLCLFALLALLGGSMLLSGASLGWRVVVNELAFLGLPLIAYLVLTRSDLRKTLRLRGVPWTVAGLSLLVGLGLWHFDSWVAAVVAQVLDYTIPLPPEALNLTTGTRLAMVVGTVVLAPVVEELFFRGALLSAYERLGPVPAIVASSLLFVIIHQELAQSIAILPVAFALAYVAQRTGSIVPAILVHVGNNAQAMLLSFLQAGGAPRLTFAPSTAGALIGAVVAVGALWRLRSLSLQSPSAEEPEHEMSGPISLRQTWPLIPMVVIYTGVIALGILLGIRPGVLAFGQSVELASPPWREQRQWTYEISNGLDERVGQAQCSLTPHSASLLLECSMEQSAYQADAPTGFFSQGRAAQWQRVRWDRQTLDLVEATIEATFSGGPDEVRLEAVVEDGVMTVDVDEAGNGDERHGECYVLSRADGEPSTEDPCRVERAFLAGGGIFSPLMVGEWPWRLSALPFEVAYSREATLVWPYRSAEAFDGRAPVRQESVVVVRTAEQISTPAGDFVAWRVTVGERYTAWYAADPPHDLVAFSDDMVTWQLAAVD